MSRPEIPAYSPESILIVCLSRPTTPEAHDQLALAVDDAVSAQLHSHNKITHLLRCGDGKWQARLEDQHKDASNTEIFIAVSRAREKGWSRMAVVDNLTYRQLAGNLRHGEKTEPSLVSLQFPQHLANAPGEILARRFNISTSIGMLAHGEDFKMTPWQEQKENDRYLEGRIFDEYGMALLDPDRPLFTPNFGEGSYSREQLRVAQQATGRALPPELTDMVMNLINEEAPLHELTDAPERLDFSVASMYSVQSMALLHVHALVPISDVAVATRTLNEKLSRLPGNMSSVIYPWKAKLPATRRDFWRLWDRIINENPTPFYMAACFLDSGFTTATEDDATEDVTLTVALSEYNNPAFVYQLGLETVVPLWQKYFHKDYSTQGRYTIPDEAVRGLEIQYHPDSRYFFDPPIWFDLTRGAPPVFFLTKKVKHEEVEQLKHMIGHELGDATDFEDVDGHPYNFVDWEKEEDGHVEDMVRIAAECRYYQGGRQGPTYIIFIDQQTFQDEKVIVSSYEEFFAFESLDATTPRINSEQEAVERHREGIKYVRTPISDVYEEWANLYVSNMDWDELYDENDAESSFQERKWLSDDERRRFSVRAWKSNYYQGRQ